MPLFGLSQLKHHRPVLVVSIFAVFLLVYLFVGYTTEYSSFNERLAQSLYDDLMFGNSSDECCDNSTSNARRPLFVAWTTYFGGSLVESLRDGLKDCDVRCDVTDDRRRLKDASAVVLHGRDIDLDELPPKLPPSIWRRRGRQPPVYALFLLESPVHSGDALEKLPPNYFDATLTYRRDSSYPRFYDRLDPLNSSEHVGRIWNEVVIKVKKKSKGLLYLVSHCSTDSARESVAYKLKQAFGDSLYTEYGSCVGRECNATCEEKEVAAHKFYLAFENSVCRDYVTEKFWRLKSLTVPVVLRRADYATVAPASSFVALDDFRSVDGLVDRLRVLMRNQTEYLRYFLWTRRFSQSASRHRHSLCQFCADLHASRAPPRPPQPSLMEWWSSSAHCEHHFANRFL